MGKLKNLLSNVSQSVKDTFQKYPITIIVVYITTLIYAFGTTHFLKEFNKNDGLIVMAVWAIGAFFVENWFSKKSFKFIGGILSLGIAIFFVPPTPQSRLCRDSSPARGAARSCVAVTAR